MFKIDEEDYQEEENSNSKIENDYKEKSKSGKQKRHAISGMDDLVADTEKLIKQSTLVYKESKTLQNNMNNKVNIAKSIISQEDLKSVVKLINGDIVSYMLKSTKLLSTIRKNLISTQNKVDLLLETHTDKTYISAYDKLSLLKNIEIQVANRIHNNKSAGIFLISLADMKDKNITFMQNIQKNLVRDIYSELRFLDNVYYLGNNVFASMIIDIDISDFEFIIKRIKNKVSNRNLDNHPIVSACMLHKEDNPDALLNKLNRGLGVAKTSDGYYHFSKS